jgi:hypothetical protein
LRARLPRGRVREVSEVASILVLIVFHFGFQPLFFLQIWQVEVLLGWLGDRAVGVLTGICHCIFIHTQQHTQPTLSGLSVLWFGCRPETDNGSTRDPQGPQGPQARRGCMSWRMDAGEQDNLDGPETR